MLLIVLGALALWAFARWLVRRHREPRRDVEARRKANPWPVPGSRHERLVEAKRRMDEELAVEHAANEWYEHYRATG